MAQRRAGAHRSSTEKTPCIIKCWSRWPRGLCAVARFFRSRVRIPLRAWIFVSCVCCVGSGFWDRLATRSDVFYSECECLIECGLETSTTTTRRTGPYLGSCAMEENKCDCVLGTLLQQFVHVKGLKSNRNLFNKRPCYWKEFWQKHTTDVLYRSMLQETHRHRNDQHNTTIKWHFPSSFPKLSLRFSSLLFAVSLICGPHSLLINGYRRSLPAAKMAEM
jgi:hypothetical protein